MTSWPESRPNIRGKLLFFVTEDWYFVSHRLTLAVSAKAAGYEVAVLTRVRAHGGLIRDSGLRLIPFEIARTGLNPFREAWTLFRLIRLYRKERPDLLHHVALKPVLYGSIAARWAGRPAIVNALAGMGWLCSSWGATHRVRSVVRSILTRLLKRGLTIVQNPEDARMLVEAGVPASLIKRIPGAGVDPRLYGKEAPDSGPPLVVLVARMLWDKGVGDFVEAATRIRHAGFKARFALVGIPDPENPTSVPDTQLRAWHERGHIEWWGYRADIPAVLAKASIACLPTFYGEGVPKALIEAMASRRPIVTTDIPGCRELVDGGRNGILVAPRDVNALTAALEALIRDPERCRRMGEAGRLMVEKSLSLDHVLQETINLYQELVPLKKAG